MSAICSGNPSVPNAGIADSLVIDSLYAQSLLPTGWQWMVNFLPWFKGVTIGNVGAFCAADPPSWTVPSGSDFLAFLTGGPLGQAQVVSDFIADVCKLYLWHHICHCTVVSTPASPAAASEPSGLPYVNPFGVTSPPEVTPCVTAHVPQLAITGTQQFFRGGTFWDGFNATSAVVRLVNSGAVGAAPNVLYGFQQEDAHPTTVLKKNENFLLGPATDFTFTRNIEPGANQITIKVTAQGGSGSTTTEAFIDLYCQGNPATGVQQGCCPPDPQLMGMLQQLRTSVELIQRQAVPFAYVYGDNHAGLTGDGEIDVSGLLGVSIDITTLPASYGRADGTPVHLFDVGRVALGTVDGYGRAREISSDGTLFLPPAAGAFTKIGYTLSPGVVASIRELVREP